MRIDQATDTDCMMDAGEVQRPHRHNSVALDLAVHAAPGAYTLMGKELDSHGWVKDPVRYTFIP